jgi:ppGpp synthetase/RelA/SpoT-type nucleotidyltranferase
MDNELLQKILAVIDERRHYFETFQQAVVARFEKDPRLNSNPPILHSIKSRIKNRDRLGEKIERKNSNTAPITTENVFQRITDIAGVRVLHICQQDFADIHACVRDQINRGDWVFHEQPTAYTWDPESRAFFEGFGLDVQVKESFYTSIHYVIRPRPDSEVACEIQVRTLFEEIWGEIDHQINYPAPTTNLACREQLRVLARLVGAGSRLADAIYRTYRDSQNAA